MRVNGRDVAYTATTIRDILIEENISPRGIAVAINGAVVPRSEWDDHHVRDSDDVEILAAAAGG